MDAPAQTPPVTSVVAFRLNGREEHLEVPNDETLLETLRDRFALTSVRGTCGLGVCGTCTVLLDEKVASACILLTVATGGRAIVTSEGLLGPDGELAPVQQAFLEADAYQCSFCIPAMHLAVKAYLESTPAPDLEGAVAFLGGNLCRCGTYPQIKDAVRALLAGRRAGSDSRG
ncbi:MAG: (2Fe-2S)-binding protein [Egibacteraceae bacterium]